MKRVAVVGGGPAGLMAAETLAHAGVSVTVYETKPSLGRKFLMAGKSGLNLTMDVDAEHLIGSYDRPDLSPALRTMDAECVKSWARGLGQPVFTGSTGRVFPHAMKASPLLRAWLQRLTDMGVTFRTRWRWSGFAGQDLIFHTPDGTEQVRADASILTMGGASWSRLGSDGGWTTHLSKKGVPLAPFAPSNAALDVLWSSHMHDHFGQAIKSVAWHAGSVNSRGEAILSERGLEGGGIYALSPAIRRRIPVTLDLFPDLEVRTLASRVSRPRGRATWTTHLRKCLGLTGARLALAQEWMRPFPENPQILARQLKQVPVRHTGLRPLDEAISTVGGVAFDGLTPDLMLRNVPGVFCAGEMLDWDAPTGGYLITGCLATGQWAGRGALSYLHQSDSA